VECALGDDHDVARLRVDTQHGRGARVSTWRRPRVVGILRRAVIVALALGLICRLGRPRWVRLRRLVHKLLAYRGRGFVVAKV
jgi:hypothetical protein